jgi:cytosine/uracil/thiamine/allantoin permease
MRLRMKLATAAFAAIMLAGAPTPSKAKAIPLPPAAAPATAGLYFVGGFLGVVAALCIYDIIQKINGEKNWDGTAKNVHHSRRHR